MFFNKASIDQNSERNLNAKKPNPKSKYAKQQPDVLYVQTKDIVCIENALPEKYAQAYDRTIASAAERRSQEHEKNPQQQTEQRERISQEDAKHLVSSSASLSSLFDDHVIDYLNMTVCPDCRTENVDSAEICHCGIDLRGVYFGLGNIVYTEAGCAYGRARVCPFCKTHHNGNSGHPCDCRVNVNYVGIAHWNELMQARGQLIASSLDSTDEKEFEHAKKMEWITRRTANDANTRMIERYNSLCKEQESAECVSTETARYKAIKAANEAAKLHKSYTTWACSNCSMVNTIQDDGCGQCGNPNRTLRYHFF